MCSGGKKRREKVRAENKQKRLNKEAEKKQKQLDRLAEERMLVARQQQAQSAVLQQQMVDQQVAQTARAEGLQAEQAKTLGGIKSRGQSVVSSLQILGQRQPTAPTASQTARAGGRRGASSTQANVARGSARSRGTNLSI